MSKKYFIWPTPSDDLQQRVRRIKRGKVTEIEALLKQRYQLGEPVIVSSARAGIVLTLTAQNLSRPDYVEIFPFASHCVIEAVGRVATPIPSKLSNQDCVSLIYHQWGYIQQRENLNTRFIEDAVDSFCLSGAELFPLKGMYEIWSLPKLIGSLGGGVVWCRDEEAAREIKDLRDTRNNNTQLRWVLKLLSCYWSQFDSFWFSAESAGGPIPRWAVGDILYRLENWEKIYLDRLERIEIVKSLLPDWLELPENRLPSVIPVVATKAQSELLIDKGFYSGLRSFEKFNKEGASELVRLFPLPIHQDVPCELLEFAKRLL